MGKGLSRSTLLRVGRTVQSAKLYCKGRLRVPFTPPPRYDNRGYRRVDGALGEESSAANACQRSASVPFGPAVAWTCRRTRSWPRL